MPRKISEAKATTTTKRGIIEKRTKKSQSNNIKRWESLNFLQVGLGGKEKRWNEIVDIVHCLPIHSRDFFSCLSFYRALFITFFFSGFLCVFIFILFLLMLCFASFSFVFQFTQFVCFWPNAYSGNNRLNETQKKQGHARAHTPIVNFSHFPLLFAGSARFCFEIVLEWNQIPFNGTTAFQWQKKLRKLAGQMALIHTHTNIHELNQKTAMDIQWKSTFDVISLSKSVHFLLSFQISHSQRSITDTISATIDSIVRRHPNGNTCDECFNLMEPISMQLLVCISVSTTFDFN